MALRHLISINDLTNEEIEHLFSRAEEFLAKLGSHATPRIARSSTLCDGAILATLFYEPSTRTRLSFEGAMSRLGGRVISSADPGTSSAAKGETLADTMRIVSAYADIIVLRHPREGAAKLASAYAGVPVINGGDGAHEHPTQTLCDLFTIRRERGRIENLNVALFGDLRGSRTIHSLAYALARFGANLLLMPAPGMELPEHMQSQLQQIFDYVPAEVADSSGTPHTLLVPRRDVGSAHRAEMDVLYLTRYQKERWANPLSDYPVVNGALLDRPCFKQAIVLHPLPRVTELDPEFDADPRAAYFRQASYGVPVRMALISMFLSNDSARVLSDTITADRKFEGSPAACSNPNCISRIEGTPRFRRTPINSPRWHCIYCNHNVGS